MHLHKPYKIWRPHKLGYCQDSTRTVFIFPFAEQRLGTFRSCLFRHFSHLTCNKDNLAWVHFPVQRLWLKLAGWPRDLAYSAPSTWLLRFLFITCQRLSILATPHTSPNLLLCAFEVELLLNCFLPELSSPPEIGRGFPGPCWGALLSLKLCACALNTAPLEFRPPRAPFGSMGSRSARLLQAATEGSDAADCWELRCCRLLLLRALMLVIAAVGECRKRNWRFNAVCL